MPFQHKVQSPTTNRLSNRVLPTGLPRPGAKAVRFGSIPHSELRRWRRASVTPNELRQDRFQELGLKVPPVGPVAICARE
jgi:hypothetical protein